jgi:RimJ/RimL family protein N-acetyltransferase/acyl carrier protein
MNNRLELTEDDFYTVLDSVVPGAELNNSRIYFTRLAMSGLREMHEYSTADKRFYDYLEYEPFKSTEDTEAYLKRLISLEEGPRQSRASIGWFIRKVENHKIIGTARFVNIDYKRQSISWGYGLDPTLWGQGYIQEVQRDLLDYIFNRLSLNRLYGSAMIENKQTISSLLSIGIKEEGVHPQAMRDSKGIYHNSWSYGMLYEDYKKSRVRASSNADAQERQITSGERVSTHDIESLLRVFLYEYGDVDIDFPFEKLPYWDSLKQMELVVAIETKVTISITTEELIKFKSIRSVIETVSKRQPYFHIDIT